MPREAPEDHSVLRSILRTKCQNDGVLLSLDSEVQEAIHIDKTFPEKHFTPE